MITLHLVSYIFFTRYFFSVIFLAGSLDIIFFWLLSLVTYHYI